MKKLFYQLFIALCLPAFCACSDDNEPTTPPPSKGEEAVEEIVEKLESKPEVSEFVELLKRADMADVAEEQLTVFAVKNQTAASSGIGRTEALDEASLKRHIAKGSYTKEKLTDGMKLESISEDTLYITRTGNDVFVNGVVIEGEAIPAGNSFVFVVPEVIQAQDAPVTYKHQTTINVKELIAKNLMEGVELPPLTEVTVTAKDGNNNQAVGSFKTNEEGIAVISHNCDTLTYRLEKTDFNDLNDGWIYAGTLDANGNFTLKDLNGDGVIDNNDKVYNTEFPYTLDYRNVITEANSTQEHFMTAVDKVNEIIKAWETARNEYYSVLYTVDRQLLTGDGGFNYETDVTKLSESYWNMADKTRNTLVKLEKSLAELGEDVPVVTMDLRDIEISFYEYYGQVPYYNTEELTNQLILDIETLPKKESMVLKIGLAKIYLLGENYQQALNTAQEVNYEGFSTPESLLIPAIAYKKLGNDPEALKYMNQARELLGWEPYSSVAGTELIETCHSATGRPYAYYRVLNQDINYLMTVPGFSAPKNHLLPVPQSALNVWETLVQNSGY